MLHFRPGDQEEFTLLPRPTLHLLALQTIFPVFWSLITLPLHQYIIIPVLIMRPLDILSNL